MMERIVDLTMTNLFQLAEYVLDKCHVVADEPVTLQSQPVAPTIRFSNEDRMVEGDLFKS